jgi:hypothetical protein
LYGPEPGFAGLQGKDCRGIVVGLNLSHTSILSPLIGRSIRALTAFALSFTVFSSLMMSGT